VSVVTGLSEALQPIVAYELQRGNVIARIDQPAGTRCPLAVIFSKPLDVSGFKQTHGLPIGVDTWENRDRHYLLESGYICERTRHAVAGPVG
jgi:hypothetical protein